MDTNKIIVVIPYLASAAQGNELELAVTGWRKHFREPHHIIVVGDWHSIVGTGDDITFVNCPQIKPVRGQYLPHLDHVHKFREVRKMCWGSEGFIYTCDDIYATADFGMQEVLTPKCPEIGPDIKPYDWRSNAIDWWSDRGKTAELCIREGLPARDWVCHLPVYYEWDKLYKVYDMYDCDHESYIVENIYFNKYYPKDVKWIEAKYVRDEVRTANPGIHPIGKRTWISNANCGWSEKLEEILRKHYDSHGKK